MLQCRDCEYFSRSNDGTVHLACDPHATIKEPECLQKWMLIRQSQLIEKVDVILQHHEATAEMHRRLRPIQEKMFRYMEQEIESAQESDSWKSGLPQFDDAEEEDESGEFD